MGCTLREKEHPFLINQYEVLGDFSFICSEFLLYSHQSNGKKEVLYDRCEENILVGRLVGCLLPLPTRRRDGVGLLLEEGREKVTFVVFFPFLIFNLRFPALESSPN